MRPGVWQRSHGKLGWQLKLQLPTRHLKPPAGFVNGYGPAPLGRCVRSQTGQAVLIGPRVSNVQRKPNDCQKVWIGISGSAPHRNVLLIMLTCPSFGEAGWTLVVAHWATWAPTVLTQFSGS